MDTVVLAYLAYLALSLGLTFWVGRTLHKNGRAFLVRVFSRDEDLADSVNHLLLVGFYLVNLGFIAFRLKTSLSIEDARGAIELLAVKVGVVTLVLGAMHFLNLYVFSRIWRARAPDEVPAAPPGARPPAYRAHSSLLSVPEGAGTPAAVPAAAALPAVSLQG